MPEDMPENREIRLKKLRFRSHHMGTAENDSDLYNWISGLKTPPVNRKTDVFQMILDFKYHL